MVDERTVEPACDGAAVGWDVGRGAATLRFQPELVRSRSHFYRLVRRKVVHSRRGDKPAALARCARVRFGCFARGRKRRCVPLLLPRGYGARHWLDRKSTRLNSSHVAISYAVCVLQMIM